jgi:hypothetical protein
MNVFNTREASHFFSGGAEIFSGGAEIFSGGAEIQASGCPKRSHHTIRENLQRISIEIP